MENFAYYLTHYKEHYDGQPIDVLIPALRELIKQYSSATCPYGDLGGCVLQIANQNNDLATSQNVTNVSSPQMPQMAAQHSDEQAAAIQAHNDAQWLAPKSFSHDCNAHRQPIHYVTVKGELLTDEGNIHRASVSEDKREKSLEDVEGTQENILRLLCALIMAYTHSYPSQRFLTAQNLATWLDFQTEGHCPRCGSDNSTAPLRGVTLHPVITQAEAEKDEEEDRTVNGWVIFQFRCVNPSCNMFFDKTEPYATLENLER